MENNQTDIVMTEHSRKNDAISGASGENIHQNGASPDNAAPGHGSEGEDGDSKVIGRVGQLTRVLHDSLRELGYDKRLEKAAVGVPEAQDRLTYVAVMTQQAAERVLGATEIAKPIQNQLAEDAARLSDLWKQALDGAQAAESFNTSIFKDLIEQTRHYLDDTVPAQTDATNAQLTEIMMAQDFQDLTGQVIKKTTHLVQTLENELLQVLLESMPKEDRPAETNTGLMNGPVINAAGRTDIVADQNQVDDLLASLGF